MKKMMFFILILTLSPQFSLAVEPGEMLDDPLLEARARDISKSLRCLVCQNQSIDDSDADLAKDLRIIVRERLTAGDNNEEIKNYLVVRYGSYILLKPPINIQTILLWAGPFIILLVAFMVVFFWYRRHRTQMDIDNIDVLVQKKLSADEQSRLEMLLREE